MHYLVHVYLYYTDGGRPFFSIYRRKLYHVVILEVRENIDHWFGIVLLLSAQ